MGNFPLFPQICPDDVIDNCNFRIGDRAVPYINSSVKGNPGYFSLSLANGISAEMTVTQHTALYQFTFPTTEQGGNGSAPSPLILLDLTDLWASRQNATVIVDDNGRITGNGTFLPSFGSGSYVSHYCVDFSGTVRDTGIWVNNRAGTQPKELFVTRGINLFYIEAGGFVRFEPPPNGTISARVGVSFISADKACQNAENEIPGPTWNFDLVRQNAESAWRQKFAGISINANGVSQNLQTSFWSGIYRTMQSPQDYTGENPLWESTEPYFDSFYW